MGMKINAYLIASDIRYIQVYQVYGILNLNDVCTLDWLQSLKLFFINMPYHILVASLTLMALF